MRTGSRGKRREPSGATVEWECEAGTLRVVKRSTETGDGRFILGMKGDKESAGKKNIFRTNQRVHLIYLQANSISEK